MSYGLARHMIAASHPVIYPGPTMGFDDLGGDDEIGAEAAQMIQAGWNPRDAIQRARQHVWQRRMSRCPQPPPQGRGYDMGYEMVSGDDDDESPEETFGEEMELDELGADDEEMGAENSPAEINGTIDRLERKTGRIKRKIQELQMKMSALPRWKERRRRRIANRIQRLERMLSRKEDRLARKTEKFAARFPAAPIPGRRNGSYGDRTTEGFQYAAERSNPIPTPNYTNIGGEEIVLPFFFDGEPYLLGSYTGAGGALQSLDISAQTRQKDYAQLFIKALRISYAWQSDMSSQISNFNDVLLTGYVTNLTASGGFNLFYDTQPFDVNHQIAGDGKQRATVQIDGLRDNALLRENATATLDGSIISLLDPTAGIDVVVTAALVCTRIADDWAGRRAA